MISGAVLKRLNSGWFQHTRTIVLVRAEAVVDRQFAGAFKEEDKASNQNCERLKHSYKRVAAVRNEKCGNKVNDQGNRSPADESAYQHEYSANKLNVHRNDCSQQWIGNAMLCKEVLEFQHLFPAKNVVLYAVNHAGSDE